MVKLNDNALADLEIDVPTYDRTAVTVGIVHVGVGAFHRAHQAMYVDRLMNQGQDLDWGICGVGVLESDRAMRDALEAQDHLYTLVLKHPDGTYEPRVIGSIVDFLLAPDDPEAVIERMAAPSTRIISLTVTEGGYSLNPSTGEFDPAVGGADRDLDDGPPSTFFGLIIEALRRRRDRDTGPLTVMSCDNIQGNGDVARRAFLAFAKLKDADLASWIEQNVPFPNSMVDRITPRTTDADREELAERFGVDDAWPVVCEPFTQWVVEDSFAAGRPAFEDVGVQMVDDVEPYELMKLRLLNASHQALAYFGHLCGYELVHDAAQDETFRRFLASYMEAEGSPTLAPLPGVDLPDYRQTLIERFSNPQVRDTVARLAAESSDRIPKWLLPVVRHNLEHNGSVTLSAAIVASWARYAEGTDERGTPIEVVDRLADVLMPIAVTQRDNPVAFLENREVFGNLIDEPRFVQAYTWALRSLHERGARRTLEVLVGS